MNPRETQELAEFIVKIKNKYDLTVFMIEHHMDLVMQISDRIYVLDFETYSTAHRVRYKGINVLSMHIWGWPMM